MRILLSGISSFSGSYFASALAAKNHEVFGTLTQPADSYVELRKSRLENLNPNVTIFDEAPIGSQRFLESISNLSELDVFCLHHASVGDYKSNQFDVVGAINSATHNYQTVAEKLVSKGVTKVVLTRSIFESEFGIRSERRAVNLYGVAKKAVSEIWKDIFVRLGIEVVDFVITNPFGALEEKRFISYLFNTWSRNEVPELQAPTLVRDNVPIDLLARSYSEFVTSSQSKSLIPSSIVGNNFDFAKLISSKFSTYFGFTPEIKHANNIVLSEPLILAGQQKVSFDTSQEETMFWEKFVNYYSEGRNK